jgi:hypothetical protein
MEPEQHTEQRTVEQLDRMEALSQAVRHKTSKESADEIVRTAQKYFEFLQRKTEQPVKP